jgi:hypothetical protein
MLRYIIGILVSLFVLSFVRAVWGIIQKALVEEVTAATGGDGQSKDDPKQTTAETTLRKCVTCGTYKPESAMIRYGAGPKSVFFCSKDCEKKANA